LRDTATAPLIGAVRPWLSPDGTAAAVAVGVAVAAGTGWRGVVLLAVFLASASLLTPGGGRRRAVQVAANGGVAAVCALLASRGPTWTLAFAGAVAAAAADTWSTEIGGKSRHDPRLITTGRPVARGTSGGVTLVGSLGGVAGAALIGATAALLRLASPGEALWLAAAGVAGGLGDSVLGATVQARYRCDGCGALGETARHGCGGRGVRIGGLGWITNDTVNAMATLMGAAVAAAPALARAAG
jgi:uncharacterized membrane protein